MKTANYFTVYLEFNKLFGIQNGRQTIEQHVQVMRDFGIPTVLRKTSGKNRTAVLKSVTNKLLQARRGKTS